MKPSLFAVLVAVVLVSGCAGTTRQREVRGSSVDTGAGSLESVRRQLMGTWVLESYSIYQGTRAVQVPAQADLTYDGFGNLTMRGTLKNSQGAPGNALLMLNYSGRSVIDVRAHKLYLQDIKQEGDSVTEEIAKTVDPAQVRLYEFRGSSLRLTVTGSDGAPTALSVWNKRPN